MNKAGWIPAVKEQKMGEKEKEFILSGYYFLIHCCRRPKFENFSAGRYLNMGSSECET